MISILDLIGSMAATAALVRFFLNGHRTFSLGERWIVLVLCSTTAIVNGLSASSWFGHDVLSDIAEDWADYLQILQPAFWGMFFYVVVQSHQRRELAASQERLREVVENMPVILTAYDREGRVRSWNKAAEIATGYSADEVAGEETPPIFFADDRMRKTFKKECALGGGDYLHRLMTIEGRQGVRHIAWSNISRRYPVAGWANWSIGLDMTESVESRQRLEFMAGHDELTGLVNRRLLRTVLDNALRGGPSKGTLAALIMLDLDNYKMVNDSHGHLTGDRLLKYVADRLVGAVGPSATVARIGGDEFLILIPKLQSIEEAGEAAENALQVLKGRPYEIDGTSIYTEASAGITVFPQDGTEPEDLLKNVDMALYAAKENGRNGYCFYTRELHDRFRWQYNVAEHLRIAIQRNGLQLNYQPQISVQTEHIIGAEALVRWPGFEGGSLSPAVFVPIAESKGLMLPLGDWVLKHAFEQCERWKQRRDFTTGVNLSAIQLFQNGLVDDLKLMTEKHDISPEAVDLEITESAVMRDADQAIASMKRLRNSGFHISLDDFGTGYSSLSYLKRFPVSRIKIDQSFVRGMEESAEDAAIVQSVIRLGHNLGLKVVAEGVENVGQWNILNESGCDIVQGYYFSPPVPVGQMNEMLAAGLQ